MRALIPSLLALLLLASPAMAEMNDQAPASASSSTPTSCQRQRPMRASPTARIP